MFLGTDSTELKTTSPRGVGMNVYNRFIHHPKNWKQPRCLLIDEWTNKLWHTMVVEEGREMKKNSTEDFYDSETILYDTAVWNTCH